MKINERIKELRKAAGLTQQKFAEQIGLKRNTIGNYEINLIIPSDRTISDICREFNVSEEWLRTGNGEMFFVLDEDQELAAYARSLMDGRSSFEKKMILMIKRMSPEKKQAFESLVMELCEVFKDK